MMSEVVDVFKHRRSIRKFQSRPVPLETIRDILDTARYAPSAHNAQPWRFLVLTETTAKLSLAEAMAEAWQRDLERDGVTEKRRLELAKASVERIKRFPVLILCCLTLQDMVQFSDDDRLRNERDLALQSLAAAIQNLLLEADVKGLGACWLCSPLFCKNAVKEELKLPDDIEPQALIAIGYPAEFRAPPQRKPLKDIAFLNRWANSF
jgi:coenzyme F420-0:L-glutamate ligase / coenzyme F420-1:gamma-L-glutamate ligase